MIKKCVSTLFLPSHSFCFGQVWFMGCSDAFLVLESLIRCSTSSRNHGCTGRGESLVECDHWYWHGTDVLFIKLWTESGWFHSADHSNHTVRAEDTMQFNTHGLLDFSSSLQSTRKAQLSEPEGRPIEEAGGDYFEAYTLQLKPVVFVPAELKIRTLSETHTSRV